MSKRGERNDALSGNVVLFAMALNIGHVSYKALLKFHPTHGVYRLELAMEKLYCVATIMFLVYMSI